MVRVGDRMLVGRAVAPGQAGRRLSGPLLLGTGKEACGGSKVASNSCPGPGGGFEQIHLIETEQLAGAGEIAFADLHDQGDNPVWRIIRTARKAEFWLELSSCFV